MISKLVAFFLLAYCLVTAGGIEALNTEEKGGVIQNYYRAQIEEHPEGEMRKMPDRDFRNILATWGTLVYPSSAIAALMFFNLAWKTTRFWAKAWTVSCGLLCLAILVRFLWLGVFTAGFGGA